MSKQQLPKGFSEEQIAAIAAYYDNQSEEDELAELEEAWAAEECTLIEVPSVLVPAVEELIRVYEAAREDLKAS